MDGPLYFKVDWHELLVPGLVERIEIVGWINHPCKFNVTAREVGAATKGMFERRKTITYAQHKTKEARYSYLV